MTTPIPSKTIADVTPCRRILYSWFARQLRDDGFTNVSSLILNELKMDILSSHRLYDTLSELLREVEDSGEYNDMDLTPPGVDNNSGDCDGNERDPYDIYDRSAPATTTLLLSIRDVNVADYDTKYVALHKEEVTSVAISACGGFFSSASVDKSIKLVSATRVKALHKLKLQLERAGHLATEADVLAKKRHPQPVVLRTLYGHNDAVTCLTYHPNGSFLASGSRDQHIAVYNVTSGEHCEKRPSRSFKDTHPINTIMFHPSGDFILAGTTHDFVRWYDIESDRCFTAKDMGISGQNITVAPQLRGVNRQIQNLKSHHSGSVNTLAMSSTGRFYASGGLDGCIRIWDGVNNVAVSAIYAAHEGSSVTCVRSVAISGVNHYLLSRGRDSVIKLWDLRGGSGGNSVSGGSSSNIGLIKCFTGASDAKQASECAMIYGDDFIVGADDVTNQLCFWNIRGDGMAPTRRINSGHSKATTVTVACAAEDTFMTASPDHRARYWVSLNLMESSLQS